MLVGQGTRCRIHLRQVQKTYKNRTVLTDATWSFCAGDRVGLVGINGAGKSTQLRILAKTESPDSGTMEVFPANTKVALLEQEVQLEEDRTLYEELASVFGEAPAARRRRAEIEAELGESTSDVARVESLVEELTRLAVEADLDADSGSMDRKIGVVMHELGFDPGAGLRPLGSFSGGWKMRVCLARVLLQDPDVLLLDEPTNHLDVRAIEWLEARLLALRLPLVLVSHDRQLLDRVCTSIVEVERGRTTSYRGNYTQYLLAKRAALARQWTAWEARLAEEARLRDMVARLSAGSGAGRASSAQRELEVLRSGGAQRPFVPKKRAFSFPPIPSMGRLAVRLTGVGHHYDSNETSGGFKPLETPHASQSLEIPRASEPIDAPSTPAWLFRDITLDVSRGERVAVLGPNGAGKSTLLRLVAGLNQPAEGCVALGPHRAEPNYYAQSQADALDPGCSVEATLRLAAPAAAEHELKALLGRMQLGGESLARPVGALSGGEKARLALARFMLRGGSVLVLDEPTNHLDIPTKEILEEALRAFEGAVILASHDRFFLRKVATRVLTLERGVLTDHQGSFEDLLRRDAAERALSQRQDAELRELRLMTVQSQSRRSRAERMMESKGRSLQLPAPLPSTKPVQPIRKKPGKKKRH